MNTRKLQQFLKSEGVKPIETIRTNCRFCGVAMWAQADNKEPACDECEDLEMASLSESYEVEDTIEAITKHEEWRR